MVRVGGDDALLVMGKRTRVLPGNQLCSTCTNGCEHLCRGRSSAGASNPGLLGAPMLPRAWGTRSSHVRRQGCVPSLPAREQGREMGPFFPFSPSNCPVPTIPMGTLQPWCWSVLLRNRSLLPRVWGGAAALARGSDGRDVQCSGLHLGLGFLSPSPAAICHMRLDNRGWNRFCWRQICIRVNIPVYICMKNSFSRIR